MMFIKSLQTKEDDFFRKTLQHCKNIGFVNIGRGNVISEEDILFALNEGMFKKVVLDVFKEEPLPKSSPLWSHPDVTGGANLI